MGLSSILSMVAEETHDMSLLLFEFEDVVIVGSFFLNYSGLRTADINFIKNPTAPRIPTPANTILMLIQYVFQSGRESVLNRRPADWKNSLRLILFNHWNGK